MPEFPWDSIPEDEEKYVALDMGTLLTIRELIDLATTHPHALRTIKGILRVATIDHHSGRLVVAMRVVRDLDT